MESSGDGFYGYKKHCYLSKVGKGKQASWKTKVHRPGLFEEEPALKMVMICPVVGDGDGLSLAPAGGSWWGPHLDVKSWKSTFLNVWGQRCRWSQQASPGSLKNRLLFLYWLSFGELSRLYFWFCRWIFQVGSFTGKAWEAGHMNKIALMVRFSTC